MTPSIEKRIRALGIPPRTRDEMFNVLISIGERQQRILERYQGMLDRQQEMPDDDDLSAE